MIRAQVRGQQRAHGLANLRFTRGWAQTGDCLILQSPLYWRMIHNKRNQPIVAGPGLRGDDRSSIHPIDAYEHRLDFLRLDPISADLQLRISTTEIHQVVAVTARYVPER